MLIFNYWFDYFIHYEMHLLNIKEQTEVDSRSVPSASPGSLWPSVGREPGCDWTPDTDNIDLNTGLLWAISS